jgi:hypothetical protein
MIQHNITKREVKCHHEPPDVSKCEVYNWFL